MSNNVIGAVTIGETVKPKPIIIQEKQTNPWWLILTISAIILIIGWLILIFLIIESLPQVYESDRGQVLITCSVGQCAVNRFNGVKRCPPQGQATISDAALEVCSAATICDNPLFPYAVQSDQSTNILGTCEPNTTCRCLANPQCPQYILSAFRANLGNPFVSLEGQRTSFIQFISSEPQDTTEGSVISDNTPIVYDNDGLNFCTIPVDWIARSQPGCGFIQNITPEAITTCMGGPSQCNPDVPLFNPCSRGTLAFITDNSDEFTAQSIEEIPMGCVPGFPCPCGQVAVFDTKAEIITCRTIV